MIELLEFSDMQTAALLIGVVSLVIGAVFTLWPGKVQKHDLQMTSFFASAEKHRAFIKGCGFILLCLAAASLLGAILS